MSVCTSWVPGRAALWSCRSEERQSGMTISPGSEAWAAFAAELGRIDDDVTYYTMTLTASPDGQMQWSTQTHFVGNGSKPLWEMRAASPVLADRMRKLWSSIGQRSIVVNSERSLVLFMRAGGNAVVAEPIFKKWFGQMLEPIECVPGRLGEGTRPLASATPAQLQHAPSRKTRMEVLKRDQFRCKACGQRPSEDANIQLHVHHVRPFGQGGLTEMHNLLTLCHTCHTGLDPHFEWQLLSLIPDGLVAPIVQLQDDRDFTEGVRRYRDVVAAELQKVQREVASPSDRALSSKRRHISGASIPRLDNPPKDG